MILVQILVAVASAIVITYSLAAINRMTAKTHHGIRASFILIAAGAFGELAAVFEGHQPGIAETLFVVGAGLFDFIDRRSMRQRPAPSYDEKEATQ